MMESCLRLGQFGELVLQGEVGVLVGLPPPAVLDWSGASAAGAVWAGLGLDRLTCQACSKVSQGADGFWRRPNDFREHDIPEFSIEKVGVGLLRQLLRQADTFALALEAGSPFGSAQCRENCVIREGMGGDYRDLLTLDLRGRLCRHGLSLNISGRLAPSKLCQDLHLARWLDADHYSLRLWLPWNVLILRDILHDDRRALFALTQPPLPS